MTLGGLITKLKDKIVSLTTRMETAESDIDSLEDKNVYSTTEKAIGTWIGGATLYRKVLSWEGSALSAGNHYLGFDEQMTELVNVYGTAYNGLNGYWYPIPSFTHGSAGPEGGIWLRQMQYNSSTSSTINFNIGAGWGGEFTKVRIIVEYAR